MKDDDDDDDILWLVSEDEVNDKGRNCFEKEVKKVR